MNGLGWLRIRGKVNILADQGHAQQSERIAEQVLTVSQRIRS